MAEISPDGARVACHSGPDMLVTSICGGGSDLQTAYVTLSHIGRWIALDWHEPGLRLHHASIE